jgi:signal transduction histidine kinase
MQRSFALLAILLAVLWTVILVTASPELDALLIISGWLFVLLLLVETFRAWRCLLATLDVWTACGVVLLVDAAMALSPPDDIVVGARGNPALVVAILAAGFLPPVRAWAVCVLVCLAQVIVCLPLDGPSGALESLWPVLSGAFAAGVLARVMRSAAARADHAQEALLAAQAQEAQAEGRRAAHRTFQRMLHDDVATALRAVAGRGVTRTEARRTCADAVAAMSRAPTAPVTSGTRNLAEDIKELGTVLPIETTFHIEGDVHVPAPVATAMLAAAREALRNVDRHAFAGAVSVRLTEDGHRVVLIVSDDGVGFSPTRSRRSSWGLSQSVIDRMTEVGGTADVISAAGAGTSVRLGWTHDAVSPPVAAVRPDRAALIAFAVGDIRRPLAAVCVPYLLSMFAIAVVYSDATTGADRLTVWYSVLVLITLALIVRADRPVSGWLSFASTTVALGGLLYALSVIPADSLDDFGSWPIGALTPLFVVLLTIRSVREAVVPLVLEEIAILSLIATGGLVADSPAAVLPALLSPVFGVVMVWIIVRTVVGLGAVVADANRDQVAIAVAEAGHEARVALHQRRIEEIGAELLPFLRQIAAGREPESWQELCEQAQLLETAARDELHLPGVIDAEVRDRLNEARQAGCVVRFQSDTDAVYPPFVLRDLLAAALTGSAPPRRLTLSLYPGTEQVEVSLVTVPGDAARSARLRRSFADFAPVVDDLPEATCAQLVVRQGGSVSPIPGT